MFDYDNYLWSGVFPYNHTLVNMDIDKNSEKYTVIFKQDSQE